MAAIGTCAADSDAMKNRRPTKTKAKRPSAPKVSGRHKLSSTNADAKIALLERERDEALEQQAATAEILKTLSRSTFELQSVLESLLAKAVHLCDAERGLIYRQDSDVYRIAASYGHSE